MEVKLPELPKTGFGLLTITKETYHKALTDYALATVELNRPVMDACCGSCKGAGEVEDWVNHTNDPQEGHREMVTCPRCKGEGSPPPFLRHPAIQDLLHFTEHCLNASDEGVDYAVPRDWLDALTAMRLLEKTGRGRWAPTESASSLVEAAHALTAALGGSNGEGTASA